MEQAFSSRSTQLDLLLQLENQKILGALLKKPCSAQGLVETIKLPMNRVHYCLRKLEAAGIVEVAELQQRKGRAVKLYRATQERFEYGFEDSTADTLEGLVASEMAPLMTQFVGLITKRMAAEDVRITFSLDDHQGLQVSLSPRIPAEGKSVGLWNSLNLTDPQAEALFSELSDLRQRYNRISAKQDNGSSKPYALGLFFTQGEF